MKATCYCEQCRKNVKIKEIHFAGFNATLFLSCAHDVHYVFAYKSKADHANLSMMNNRAFDAVVDPSNSHFP